MSIDSLKKFGIPLEKERSPILTPVLSNRFRVVPVVDYLSKDEQYEFTRCVCTFQAYRYEYVEIVAYVPIEQAAENVFQKVLNSGYLLVRVDQLNDGETLRSKTYTLYEVDEVIAYSYTEQKALTRILRGFISNIE